MTPKDTTRPLNVSELSGRDARVLAKLLLNQVSAEDARAVCSLLLARVSLPTAEAVDSELARRAGELQPRKGRPGRRSTSGAAP